MGDGKVPPGIICALVTPFRDDQTPDLDALGPLVDFHAERGTHALFVLGTTGEGPLLSFEERTAVAEAVVERAVGRLGVVVHCGAADTRTASELARHAESIRADGVALVGPYYFRYGDEEVFRHFVAVAEAAPGIDQYVYQNPETVGYSLPVGMILRLVDEVANIRGVKDTGDSIGRVTQYLAHRGTRPDVYVGNNSIILPALFVGARGAVSALANAVPELVAGIFESWTAGRVEEARERQFTLARLHGAVAGVQYIAVIKHLMERRGLRAGGTRAPQSLLDREQGEVLERRIEAIEDLSSWLEPVGEPRIKALG